MFRPPCVLPSSELSLSSRAASHAPDSDPHIAIRPRVRPNPHLQATLDKSEPISFLKTAVQADTAVEVLSYEPPGAKPGFIITFQTVDRPGVLARITLALHDLGLEILGAEIKTKGGFVSNKFQTTRAPGKNRQQLEVRESEAATGGLGGWL